MDAEKKARALEEMGYPAEEARAMAAAHEGPMTLDFLTKAEKLLKETPPVITKPPGFWHRHERQVRIGWVVISLTAIPGFQWMAPQFSSADWLIYALGIFIVVSIINLALALTWPKEKMPRRRKGRG